MMVMSGPLGYQVSDAPTNRTVRFTNRQPMEVGRKSGTDYISTVQVTGLADGSTVFAVRIVCSVFASLSRFASSYQDIHWNKLEFQIASQMPTTGAGGYIAGFIPDPADTLPTDIQRAKSKLVATPNSIKTNIWDSSCLSVIAGRGKTAVECLPQKLLKTSPSADVREYSPGVFYLILDGQTTDAGSLSLSIAYSVSCKTESVEYDSLLGQSDRLQAAQPVFVQETEDQFFSLSTGIAEPATWDSLFPGYIKPIIDVILETVGVSTTVNVLGDRNTVTSQSYRYSADQDRFYLTLSDGSFVKTISAEIESYVSTLGACYFLIRSLATQISGTTTRNYGVHYKTAGAAGVYSNMPLKPMFERISPDA